MYQVAVNQGSTDVCEYLRILHKYTNMWYLLKCILYLEYQLFLIVPKQAGKEDISLKVKLVYDCLKSEHTENHTVSAYWILKVKHAICRLLGMIDIIHWPLCVYTCLAFCPH